MSKMPENSDPPPYSSVFPGPQQVIGPNEILQSNMQPVVTQQQQFLPQPVVLPINFGPEPQFCICPHCRSPTTTRVTSEPNTMTHGMALLMFCCLCWPCAWLPYFMDSCQNRNHYCSCCGAYLGQHANT